MRILTFAVLTLTLSSGNQLSACFESVASLAGAGVGERRGCCSHHGGVCGCEKGRALCCDGRLSPSCGCD
ncbi:hypothetical protein FBQ96_02430 [Nitrospirales bacterium NOB]|nr:hypothetical protein [Nitrospira sp. NTP2]MDL1888434.1 hypothetical protein [Nitrospirales bacterium NOB]